MKLDEIEAQPQSEQKLLDGPSTKLTISHVTIIKDEQTGMLETRVLQWPLDDPDFHLGAVGGE